MKGIKNTLLENLDAVMVFFASFMVFYLLQFSFQGIAENDSHLYIKIAEMTKDNGIMREFPWMYTSTMNSNFSGLHFLYYFLLIPFTFFGDLIFGAKLASIFFISLLFAAIYGILKMFEIRLKLLWFIFLFSSSGYFLFRMNSARPLSLSVILYLLIFYALIKRNKTLLFLSSFLSVWAHASFPIVIFLVLVFFAVEYIHEKKLDRNALVYSMGGLIAAIIANPFFPNNLTTYFSTYFSPSIPYSLTSQISEWQPLGLDMIFSDSWLLFISQVVLSVIFIASIVLKSLSGFSNKIFFEENPEKNIAINVSMVISLAFMIMTLLIGRFIDYWVPFAIIFTASYFESIYYKAKAGENWKKFDKKKFVLFSGEDLKFSLAAFLIIGVFVSARSNLNFTQGMMSHMALSENAIKENALWLKNNTPEKSIVLNINWGDFSKLFLYNTHNYYTLGLDPKFMYNLSPEKYWTYEHLKEGVVCNREKCEEKNDAAGAIYEAVKKDFNASYIFIPVDSEFDYTILKDKLSSDARFEKVFENDGGEIWAIK